MNEQIEYLYSLGFKEGQADGIKKAVECVPKEKKPSEENSIEIFGYERVDSFNNCHNQMLENLNKLEKGEK